MSTTEFVRSDVEHSRYEYVAEGQVIGVVEYRPGPGYVVIHHTHTDPAQRGQGVAARLVAGALDDLRQRNLRVVATCWYVQQYIEEHPEQQDLLHEHSQPRGSAGITG